MFKNGNVFTLPRHANWANWEFKRPPLQNEEPFRTEHLHKQRG